MFREFLRGAINLLPYQQPDTKKCLFYIFYHFNYLIINGDSMTNLAESSTLFLVPLQTPSTTVFTVLNFAQISK